LDAKCNRSNAPRVSSPMAIRTDAKAFLANAGTSRSTPRLRNPVLDGENLPFTPKEAEQRTPSTGGRHRLPSLTRAEFDAARRRDGISSRGVASRCSEPGVRTASHGSRRGKRKEAHSEPAEARSGQTEAGEWNVGDWRSLPSPRTASSLALPLRKPVSRESRACSQEMQGWTDPSSPGSGAVCSPGLAWATTPTRKKSNRPPALEDTGYPKPEPLTTCGSNSHCRASMDSELGIRRRRALPSRGERQTRSTPSLPATPSLPVRTRPTEGARPSRSNSGEALRLETVSPSSLPATAATTIKARKPLQPEPFDSIDRRDGWDENGNKGTTTWR